MSSRGSGTQRVFLSSTCHDLVDLRAEVRELLDEEGFFVVMSDEPETFALDGKADSIETCLVNLRASDAVVVVLSQRYGPPLKPLGTDKSATHVEYDEAVRHEKPLYLYVRDRLMAVYDQWIASKRSVVPESHWCSTKDAERLVQLIDEHKRLEAAKRSTNWFSIYTDSVELKRQLKTHLGVHMGKMLLERLQREGRLGWLSPSVSAPVDGPVSGHVENKCDDAFRDVRLEFASGRSQRLGDVAPRACVEFEGVAKRDTRLTIEWTSPLCGRLRDVYEIDPDGHCALIQRQLIDSSTVTLLGPGEVAG